VPQPQWSTVAVGLFLELERQVGREYRTAQEIADALDRHPEVIRRAVQQLQNLGALEERTGREPLIVKADIYHLLGFVLIDKDK
jgi:DNA-binding IscR family transcriptional regulator